MRMYGNNPRSTAAIGGHPLHPMIIPFPIVCFVGAFVADIFYVSNNAQGWATASNWLLGFGLGFAALAAATGLTDYMGDDRIRRLGVALRHMLANVTAVVLEVVNLAIRLVDQSKIESIGIFLSGATVLVLLYSGWLGGELVYRHRVGVQETTDEFSGYARGAAADRRP
jgi:uncharacterized membrane protein